MATHSSILAWRIPWTEEPGGLQSTGGKESDTTERLHFTFQSKDQETMVGWAKGGLLSVFANKVSLAPDHTHSLIYFVWTLWRQDIELNSWDRDHVVFEA